MGAILKVSGKSEPRLSAARSYVRCSLALLRRPTNDVYWGWTTKQPPGAQEAQTPKLSSSV